MTTEKLKVKSKNYKHPFIIKPVDYPKSFEWRVNRYLYLTKVEYENMRLYDTRWFGLEKLWIKNNDIDVFYKARLLMLDMPHTKHERDEVMPYMEVTDDS